MNKSILSVLFLVIAITAGCQQYAKKQSFEIAELPSYEDVSRHSFTNKVTTTGESFTFDDKAAYEEDDNGPSESFDISSM